MGRWLDKVSNSLHLVISPRREGPVNIRKIKINQKSAKNHRKDTKARVDNYPLISYIGYMKEKTITIKTTCTNQGQWANLLLELNIMKKAWKSFGVDMNIKAPGLKNVLLWGTRNNEFIKGIRYNSKPLPRNKR